MTSIDLNADVGESPVVESAVDAALIPYISSASVACGVHAGSPSVMRFTVALARAHGVAVGAHPGFPDREGFGRRERNVAPREVEDLVVYQVGALAAIAALEGVRLQHVKPHGALYSMAGRDAVLADAVAVGVARVDPSLILFGPPHSELVLAGRRAGLQTAAEAFADRAYENDGQLAPRGTSGAVIDDADAAAARALRIVRTRTVETRSGSVIVLEADTLCLHGDTPGAVVVAAAVRRVLEEGGVDVRPPARLSS
jgi:5-oxoprolinase (ATP-hydrolysing) subunit A